MSQFPSLIWHCSESIPITYFNFFCIHFHLCICHILYPLCACWENEDNYFTWEHFTGTLKCCRENWRKLLPQNDGDSLWPHKTFHFMPSWAQRKTPYENPVNRAASVALITWARPPSGEDGSSGGWTGQRPNSAGSSSAGDGWDTHLTQFHCAMRLRSHLLVLDCFFSRECPVPPSGGLACGLTLHILCLAPSLASDRVSFQ